MTFTNGYSPRSSGFIRGGGIRRPSRKTSVISGRMLKNFQNVHITDGHSLKNIVPPYDPALEFEYTSRELHLLAEKILLEDPKRSDEEPIYLSMDQLRHRQRKEVQCADGTPDPEIVSGLYWRTHPNGRNWTTAEQRKANASGFYR